MALEEAALLAAEKAEAEEAARLQAEEKAKTEAAEQAKAARRAEAARVLSAEAEAARTAAEAKGRQEEHSVPAEPGACRELSRARDSTAWSSSTAADCCRRGCHRREAANIQHEEAEARGRAAERPPRLRRPGFGGN